MTSHRFCRLQNASQRHGVCCHCMNACGTSAMHSHTDPNEMHWWTDSHFWSFDDVGNPNKQQQLHVCTGIWFKLKGFNAVYLCNSQQRGPFHVISLPRRLLPQIRLFGRCSRRRISQGCPGVPGAVLVQSLVVRYNEAFSTNERAVPSRSAPNSCAEVHQASQFCDFRQPRTFAAGRWSDSYLWYITGLQLLAGGACVSHKVSNCSRSEGQHHSPGESMLIPCSLVLCSHTQAWIKEGW